jgi:hypothetical protein
MPVKEEIDRRIRETESEDHQYIGHDWWHVMPEDIVVFDIDVKRWPRMMTAYFFYDVFLGIADVGEEEAPAALLEAERAGRADIADQGHCLRGFRMFAVEYAGLTMREAAAVYSKMTFWNVRTGLTVYEDEM